MKKILLFIILLIPFFVYAEDSCNKNDIQIESITLEETQGNVEETTTPTTTNNQVNLGLKMNVIDDTITYKLVIKNTSNQDYTFDKNSLSTKYLNYGINYEDNSDIVKAGESKTIYLTVNYSNNPSTETLSGMQYFDVSTTTNIMNFLSFNQALERVDELSKWNTSNIINIRRLFMHDYALISVEGIKNWDVRNVIDMGQTFNSCYALEEIDLSNWETNSVENLQTTFAMWKMDNNPYTDGNLKRIILSDKFDTSKVTNMYALIANNQQIEDYSFLQYIDTSSATNIAQTFQMTNFKETEYIKDWDVSKVENMKGLFLYNFSIETLDGLENWNTSSVTSIAAIFTKCTSLTDIQGLRNWDVSNVTTFANAFEEVTSLEDASAINDWNISPTATFMNMFYKTSVHPEFTKVTGTWNSAGTFTPSG